MPTYEFACTPCFERGVVSTWEMIFKIDDPKVTFCPACGKPGHQVILTAPMVIRAETREKSRFADDLTKKELDNRGITRIEQKAFDPEEAAHNAAVAARNRAADEAANPFKPRPINPMEALGQGRSSLSHAAAEAQFLGKDKVETPQIIGAFPKQIPTEVVARHDVKPEDMQ